MTETEALIRALGECKPNITYDAEGKPCWDDSEVIIPGRLLVRVCDLLTAQVKRIEELERAQITNANISERCCGFCGTKYKEEMSVFICATHGAYHADGTDARCPYCAAEIKTYTPATRAYDSGLREGYRRGQEDMRDRAALRMSPKPANATEIRALPIQELPE